MTRRPDFFIVGAAKSGTTSMHDYLRQHPAVFMPAIKELNYFGSDRPSRPSRRGTNDRISSPPSERLMKNS